MNFDESEKEFLVNLFEVMWWGGKFKGYHEAATLADAYVNGKGKKVKVSAHVYRTSKIVKTTQDLMISFIKDFFRSSNNNVIAFKSTDTLFRKKITEFRKTKKFNQMLEGELYLNGVLKSEESNKRLFYSDNRFVLQVTATRSNNGIIALQWKVESLYDFEPYDKRPWDITRLPIVHPGTKNKSQQEVQQILSEIFPEYMQVVGRYLNGILLPDGLSNYMVQQGIASPFIYYSEWGENIKF